MKLRLLNGAHSALAAVGRLAGIRDRGETIVRHPPVRRFLEALLGRGHPDARIGRRRGARPIRGAAQRFENTALRHLTAQIAGDGSQKVPQRILAPLRDLLGRRRAPDAVLFAVAAWIRSCGGCDEAAQPLPLNDPVFQAWSGQPDQARRRPGEMVEAFLGVSAVFGPTCAADAGVVRRRTERSARSALRRWSRPCIVPASAGRTAQGTYDDARAALRRTRPAQPRSSAIRRSAAPGEVLVRIRRVGVCGTDYHIYAGNQPYLEYPRVIGHELGGEVAEAPAGSALRTGQVVASSLTSIAARAGPAGTAGPTAAGACRCWACTATAAPANYIAVPERNVVPADGLEPGAGRHGRVPGHRGARGPPVRRRCRETGSLVVGAGPIGIAAAIFAKARGAACDGDRHEREAARVLRRCDRRGGAVAGLGRHRRSGSRAATGGEFFDVVIDATGSPAAMQPASAMWPMAAPMCCCRIVRAAISFDDPEFHKRETTLLGSRNATREDFETVLEAMRRGQSADRRLVHAPRPARGGRGPRTGLEPAGDGRHQGADRGVMRG